MAMNRVQFQAGLSMPEFLTRCGTQAQCLEALLAQRWPEGCRCPACGNATNCTFERAGYRYGQCRDYRQQTTVTAGTIFEVSKLPLTVWFLAMHLLTHAKNPVLALELKRYVGVWFRTAWRVNNKLPQVMVECNADRVLAGRIEIDDAYLGSECAGTPGRGSANKVPFLIAVEANERRHPLFVKVSPTPFMKAALAAWADASLDTEAYVLLDGSGGFRGITGTETCHHGIVVGSGRAAVLHPEFRCVNTILGHLKTAIAGIHQAFDFAPYAYRYLAKVQYRFNLRAILARLAHAAVTAALVARAENQAG